MFKGRGNGENRRTRLLTILFFDYLILQIIFDLCDLWQAPCASVVGLPAPRSLQYPFKPWKEVTKGENEVEVIGDEWEEMAVSHV